MLDRSIILRQYRFQWPVLDAALLASALRWLILFVILAGLLWLLKQTFRYWMKRTEGQDWKVFARMLGIDGRKGSLGEQK
jgi:hypothetical protein